MSTQFEYIDREEGLIFIIKFLPPPEKRIAVTCRYLTSSKSSPPLYTTTVDYNNHQILWDTVKVGYDFLSSATKKYTEKMLKLKMWW